MKNQKLLAPLLAAPVLLAFTLAPSRVAFAPAEGSTAVKAFKSTVELPLDNMSMTMNGQENPMMPKMDMSITMKRNVGVTDEYVKVRENAPATLRRTFDELSNDVSLSMQMDMGGGNDNSQDHDIPAASELEGKTVVFTWNPDTSEYTKAFDPAEENGDLLKDLDEDMDLRCLLPKDEVKEGDEWQIDVKKLVSILAPGGNLSLKPEDVDSDMMGGMGMGGDMSDYLSELMEGDATGKFLGMREVDGKKLAAIRISVDISSSNDMTEKVLAMMKEMDLPEQAKNMDIDHLDIEFSLKGEGELLWNLDAGRAQSFELSGPTQMTYDIGLGIEVPGQGNMDIEQTMEMSGTMNLSATFE
jgi:hypothetical protein